MRRIAALPSTEQAASVYSRFRLTKSEHPHLASLVGPAVSPDWARSLGLNAVIPARPNHANPGLAMAPGHFAQIGPVLGHLVRAAPPAHLDPAGSLLGDSLQSGSPPAHFGRAGPFAAFERAAPVLDHPAKPALGHFAPAVQARLARAHPRSPPRFEIASTRLQIVPHGFLTGSDRPVQKWQQSRRGLPPPLQSAVKPGCERLIESLASIDRCPDGGPTFRSAAP